VRIKAFFSGEISSDVSEFDELADVPPKSGPCNKANRGDTSPKKSPNEDRASLSVSLECLR